MSQVISVMLFADTEFTRKSCPEYPHLLFHRLFLPVHLMQPVNQPQSVRAPLNLLSAFLNQKERFRCFFKQVFCAGHLRLTGPLQDHNPLRLYFHRSFVFNRSIPLLLSAEIETTLQKVWGCPILSLVMI